MPSRAVPLPPPAALALLTLLAALGAACRTAAPASAARDPAPAAATASATAPAVAPADAPIARPASDPSRRLFGAQARAEAGDAAGALELLEGLDQGGWDVPLQRRGFGALADDPRFAAIAARIAARAPHTVHAPVVLTLAEPGLVAEGIAYDPVTDRLYVGSIRQRKILRISVHETVSELVPAAGHGLLSPLGLKVDRARGLLWAASMASKGMVGFRPEDEGRAALFAFDLETGALRRRVDAPAGEHLLNDVALAEDGTIVVTDSAAGAVWRLAPGATALEPFVPAGTLVYPNGVVIVGGRVLVADAFGLVAAPLAGGAPRALEGPPGVPLGGIDGLSLHRGALVGIQNALGAERIVRLRLDASGDRVEALEVLEAANPAWHVPTTGAVAGDTLLYVGTSHVDGVSPAGLTPEAAAAPTRIFRIDLPR